MGFQQTYAIEIDDDVFGTVAADGERGVIVADNLGWEGEVDAVGAVDVITSDAVTVDTVYSVIVIEHERDIIGQ